MSIPQSKNPPRIGAIVLAAGASRRMGQAKALLPFGDRPLIAHIVSELYAADQIAPIVVVTGCEHQSIVDVLSTFPAEFVRNPDYERGMLTSVQTGLRALVDRCDGVLIVLGDQLWVQRRTIAAVIKAWRARHPMLALPTFGKKHGHPILFDIYGATEILSLSPNETLKTFTSAHKVDTLDVPVDDEAILEDIDTPADYQRAMKRWADADAAGKGSLTCPTATPADPE